MTKVMEFFELALPLVIPGRFADLPGRLAVDRKP
jgi:hypothetical protein